VFAFSLTLSLWLIESRLQAALWATGYILDAWFCNALNVSVRAYEELLDLSRAPESKLQLVMSLNQDPTCKEIILKLIKEGALKVRYDHKEIELEKDAEFPTCRWQEFCISILGVDASEFIRPFSANIVSTLLLESNIAGLAELVKLFEQDVSDGRAVDQPRRMAKRYIPFVVLRLLLSDTLLEYVVDALCSFLVDAACSHPFRGLQCWKQLLRARLASWHSAQHVGRARERPAAVDRWHTGCHFDPAGAADPMPRRQ
jgi:hypothetical protein